MPNCIIKLSIARGELQSCVIASLTLHDQFVLDGALAIDSDTDDSNFESAASESNKDDEFYR
jgi:hypothetical protein